MTELQEAERDYRRALRRYERAIAETQTTADGKPFRLTADGLLYAIEDRQGWPTIRVVDRHMVRPVVDERYHLVELEDVAPPPHGGRWSISGLYVDLTAARRELVRVRKQRLAYYAREVSTLAAQIASSSDTE